MRELDLVLCLPHCAEFQLQGLLFLQSHSQIKDLILGSGNEPGHVRNPSLRPLLSNSGDENSTLCSHKPSRDAEAAWRMRLLEGIKKQTQSLC